MCSWCFHRLGILAAAEQPHGENIDRYGIVSRQMQRLLYNGIQQQHPEEKFWTYLGLARGYTAMGDKKNAIANWEIVQRNVPPNMSNRIPIFEAALRKLKENS